MRAYGNFTCATGILFSVVYALAGITTHTLQVFFCLSVFHARSPFERDILSFPRKFHFIPTRRS